MIKPATWRDLSELRKLEKVCFSKDAWPLLDLIGVLTLPDVIRLKAMDHGFMVGFIAADVHRLKKVAWIATIAVLPEYRGRGIGRALLLDCEQRLKEPTIRLSVRASNRAAIRMYQGSGYQRGGIWPAYYHDGEDALVMEKLRK